jgi:hypothetical protein
MIIIIIIIINLKKGRARNFKEDLPIHKIFSFIPLDATRLIFRQLETLKTILKFSPETFSFPDSKDFLPLHLSTFHNSAYEIVDLIYHVYPSAALVKDGDGKLAIQYVMNAKVKKLLLKSSPPLIKAGVTDSFSRFTN